MRKILKVTSILGVASLVRIFTGLVRAKFLAWKLGPAGMGLVGQAQMYAGYANQLCSCNMGLGITKDVSEKISGGKQEEISLTVNVAGSFQLLAGILFMITVLPFSLHFSKFIFTDNKYWIFFVGITIAAPFATFLGGVADPVLYGYRKVADYTKMMVTFTLAGLLLLIVLVMSFGIKGMLSQIPLVAVTGFVLSCWFLRKSTSLKATFDPRIFLDKTARRALFGLLKFGLITFIPGNVNMLVALYVRSLFVNRYGVEVNGMYQVAYAISSYYLPFVTNGIWGHFYPEICSVAGRDKINALINQFIRFVLFASIGIAALCIIFRKYAILVLFSGKFIKAYDLIAIQAIGDIFFVLFCVFSTSLMARKKFKGVILISTIGYNATLLVSYIVFSRFFNMDFRSFNAAIFLTNAVLVSVYILYYKLNTGLRFSVRTIVLFSGGAVLLIALLSIPDRAVMLPVKLSMVILWIYLSATRNEIDGFKDIAFRFIRKEKA